jgi:uncharacterized membrane protein YhaH (DUF805 family)
MATKKTAGTAEKKTAKPRARKTSASGAASGADSGASSGSSGAIAGLTAKMDSLSQALAKRKKSAGSSGIELFGIELLENFLDVMKKFTVVEGRADRKEFWMFVLAVLIIGIVLSMLASIRFLGFIAWLASFVFSIAIFIPSITLGVRRLHDRDKSGWFFLLMLIPLVGGIILLVWSAMKGTPGKNRFG